MNEAKWKKITSNEEAFNELWQASRNMNEKLDKPTDLTQIYVKTAYAFCGNVNDLTLPATHFASINHKTALRILNVMLRAKTFTYCYKLFPSQY